MTITTLVFDAYGTLFDVTGAARLAAATPEGAILGDRWPLLAAEWRRKQLEYTWQRAISGAHAAFDVVTAEALDWALEAMSLSAPALRTRLLALYDELPAFPEVLDVLTNLHGTGYRLAILSNGSPRMLASLTAAAGLQALIHDLLSVESVRVYKPDFRVYAMVEPALGVKPRQVLFISANGWDIAGATRFGFNTAWVNRTGQPMDRLPQGPKHILRDLTGVPQCL
ncbi:MAG: haloacid dehalogenase, type II [Rhodobacteraceae bacterium PARR1]|nr:MAG: haloacid dehalogenase, type II [Rhodobacteraceae bacterium PARR1]